MGGLAWSGEEGLPFTRRTKVDAAYRCAHVVLEFGPRVQARVALNSGKRATAGFMACR